MVSRGCTTVRWLISAINNCDCAATRSPGNTLRHAVGVACGLALLESEDRRRLPERQAFLFALVEEGFQRVLILHVDDLLAEPLDLFRRRLRESVDRNWAKSVLTVHVS